MLQHELRVVGTLILQHQLSAARTMHGYTTCATQAWQDRADPSLQLTKADESLNSVQRLQLRLPHPPASHFIPLPGIHTLHTLHTLQHLTLQPLDTYSGRSCSLDSWCIAQQQPTLGMPYGRHCSRA